MCNFWARTYDRLTYVRHPWNSRTCLLVFRFIAFAVITAGLSQEFHLKKNDWKFCFAFLTIHGTIFASLAFLLLTCAHCVDSIHSNCCWKFTHSLFEMAIVLSVPITGLYWGALYP